MVPLVGCPVRIKRGKHAGKDATVLGVLTYKEQLMAVGSEEASLFVRTVRSRLGDGWPRIWYKATVYIQGVTKNPVGDDSMFEILDETQTREVRWTPPKEG